MPKRSSHGQRPRRRGRPAQPHRVALLVSDGCNPFEIGIAAEIFGLPRPELGFQPYEVTYCSPTGSAVMRDGLFTMRGIRRLGHVAAADTLIVPNRPDPRLGQSAAVLRAVAAAYRRGTRIVGLCTGAFTLADAGILTGHRVTTHWRWAGEFARSHPGVELLPDVLYVDSGQVLTAAGSAAALDLCLYLVRTDWGAEVAHHVSRRLVFGSHREGGQRQFIERPAAPSVPSMFSAALEWATAHLDQPITVAALARRAAMSTSSFHRHFAAGLGTSPLQWLHGQRVDHARRLLETTPLDVAAIAEACGMGTATNLRVHFRRQVGLAPAAYRRQHAAA
jgi:AraC family transcriptional activator FtrA